MNPLDYDDLKKKHPEALLLIKIGDFYEAMWGDAEIVHRTLGVTLLKRGVMPIAGLPAHSIEGYLKRLIMAGHKPVLIDGKEGSA